MTEPELHAGRGWRTSVKNVQLDERRGWDKVRLKCGHFLKIEHDATNATLKDNETECPYVHTKATPAS